MADVNSIDPRQLSTAEFAGLLAPVTGNGIGAMDPQAFARLIKHASAEQLDAVLGDPTLRRALLDRILRRMAGQFRPENAPGRDSAIHWRITGGPGGDEVYETWITGAQGPSSPQCATSNERERMFSLALSKEHRDLRAWVHGFATDVIRPAAAEWDEREETPWLILQEAAKIELYGFETLTRLWSDETGLSLPIAHEELFWGDGGIGMAIFGTTLAVTGIFAAGTPEQHAEWIPPCYGDAGEPRVAAFCSSEPQAGSDVSAVHTRAVYHEASDEWILTGQKEWVTNGGIASVYVVQAVVDASLESRGQATFVIPAGTRGLRTGDNLRKHGLRASNTADVFLDDVRIPGANLLGGAERLVERLARAREDREGSAQAAIRSFELSRPTVAAQAIGIARAAYEYALDYAKQWVPSGRPIIENQSIAFTLGDIKTEIDAARLLVWRAAWMGKTGEKFTAGEGSMSKLKAGRVAVWATERAMQILGDAAYSREYPVERMHHAAKLYGIFEGTEQIQQLIIARAITGMPIR